MIEQTLTRQLILAIICVAAFCILSSNFSNGSPLVNQSDSDMSSSGRLVFGVNVYGWIRGDFGGGRTARSVINNLHTVGINLSAIEINGADLHSTTNMAIEEQGFALFPRSDFAFDLFIINAANTISTLMDPNNDIYQDHYRIGIWHWETSKLPLLQGSYGKYYNEIWVPTQFVADAILATESFPAAEVRVVVLPYGYESLPPLPVSEPVSVSVHESGTLGSGDGSRGHHKHVHRQVLPHILRRIMWKSRESVLMSTHAEQTFEYWAESDSEVTLFLVIFDFNSDYNRKNIVATIRAFLKAFPSDTHGGVQGSTAGLIIKSINAHNQIDDYNRLHWILEGGQEQQGITKDDRVVFFNGLCSEPDLQQLKLAADCYLSLHRSEGLGLNLLEAALGGVPVIASAYSGSEQFMRPLYSQLAPELRVPTTTVQVDAAAAVRKLCVSFSLVWTSFGCAIIVCSYD